MTTSPPSDTHKPARPASADAAAFHVKPGTECYALPLAWEAPPLKPRGLPVRIWPQSGALWLAAQPAAFREFGINE